MFVPIAKTSVDWSTLLPTAAKAVGRSVTASVDGHRSPLSEPAAYLCALAEFARLRPGDALSQLRTDALSRKHVSFTFLVNLPSIDCYKLSSFGLVVSLANMGELPFAIVSGNIDEWVAAVVQGTHDVALRKFSCLMLAWFEREGLGEAWACWEKEDVPAGFYRLVKK